MNYIDYKSGESPQQMQIAECDRPKPANGQVVVKVHAFGINRADTLQRQGKYPPPKGESDILGLEVAGEIIELGEGIEPTAHWAEGDQVFGLVAGGGYAEYVAVEAKHLMAVPRSLDMTQAAGIAEVFLTAYQSLVLLGNIQPGQRVLIHAGASGVGLAAIQLAKKKGCYVATTASSEEKLKVCQQYGADLLINYKEQDFVKVIKAQTETEQNSGIDFVLDMVAGDYVNRNLAVLNLDGMVVSLAMLAGRYADKLDMALLLGKRARLQGSTLRNRSDAYKTHLINEFSRECLDDFTAGTLLPVIDEVYPAKDIGKAHIRLEANQSIGKLIGQWE